MDRSDIRFVLAMLVIVVPAAVTLFIIVLFF